jgi:hypothetical protein
VLGAPARRFVATPDVDALLAALAAPPAAQGQDPLADAALITMDDS